jgi:hypothetical protein
MFGTLLTAGAATAASRFFQDKRVKVSLFLAEGIQQPSSGKLVVPSCINDQVGLVRSFDDTGRLEREERVQVNSQKVGRGQQQQC